MTEHEPLGTGRFGMHDDLGMTIDDYQDSFGHIQLKLDVIARHFFVIGKLYMFLIITQCISHVFGSCAIPIF